MNNKISKQKPNEHHCSTTISTMSAPCTLLHARGRRISRRIVINFFFFPTRARSRALSCSRYFVRFFFLFISLACAHVDASSRERAYITASWYIYSVNLVLPRARAAAAFPPFALSHTRTLLRSLTSRELTLCALFSHGFCLIFVVWNYFERGVK